MTKKRLKAASWAMGAAAALTALIGFAHTPQGRPLLVWLGAVPGCPLLANSDPADIEARRLVWATARNAGESAAPARPALGFELGVSRRDQVRTELERRGRAARAAHRDTALECDEVDGRKGDDALLKFDGAGRLTAVDVFHRTASSAEAVKLLRDREARLAARLGPATHARGERDARYLAAVRFRQVALEYRFSDYSARVAATNFGTDLRVREQYDLLKRL
ncbi:MAG TPA: hypothetical protein VM686_38185 [Polyangiaceae bacterium]|nr:hypothetical protein [Polyangiaceae bacterium]